MILRFKICLVLTVSIMVIVKYMTENQVIEYIYNGIVENIAQEFERELGSIMAVFNFDYGDEF